MELRVDTNYVRITKKEPIESGEYNVTPCSFEFSEEYAGLVKTAVFTRKDKTAYKMLIQNDECSIPAEVLEKEGTVELGVFGYVIEDDDLELRYSPKPCIFAVTKGSYKEAENSTPPTPTQFEQYEQALAEGLAEVSNVDIDANKVDHTATITITDRTGTQKSVEINDGENGQDGKDGKDGEDYVITQEDYQNIANVVKSQLDIPTKTSDLTNDSGYINNNVDDLINYYKKTELYNKTEIDTKISSVYRYKGTVATYGDLPSTDLTIGDVYNVETDGSNYAWNGTTWDKLGGDIDLSNYYNKTETNSLLLTKQNTIDTNNKLASNLVDDSDSVNKFVTTAEKTEWNEKVSPTDYATGNTAGVIKTANGAYLGSSGTIGALSRTYAQYQNDGNNYFIGKSTLENVITGKDLTTKAYVDSLVGNLETILETLDTGSGV